MMTNNDLSSCLLQGHKSRGTGIREEQVSITQLPYMGDKLVLGDKFKNCSDKLIWTLSN